MTETPENKSVTYSGARTRRLRRRFGSLAAGLGVLAIAAGEAGVASGSVPISQAGRPVALAAVSAEAPMAGQSNCEAGQLEQWSLSGINKVDVAYDGFSYVYGITLTQSGSCLGGTLDDEYYPTSGPVSGTVSGDNVTFTFSYPPGSIQGTRTYTGTISQSGVISGTWTQTGDESPDNGTWALERNAEEAMPTAFGPSGIVQAPPNKQCLSRRSFIIHVRQLAGLVYRQVTVDVNGHRVNVTRGRRIAAPVDLRGLPRGTYVVKITVLTTKGTTITGTRTYHTCRAHPLHPRRQPTLGFGRWITLPNFPDIKKRDRL